MTTRRDVLGALATASVVSASSSERAVQPAPEPWESSEKVSGMIEYQKVDLIPDGYRDMKAPQTTHLTAAEDPRWSGVIWCPPSSVVEMTAGAAHDVYLLRGTVLAEGTTYAEGTFIAEWRDKPIVAGREGAALFVFRHVPTFATRTQFIEPQDLVWYPGGAAGMRVAPLVNAHHRVILVSWQPGTKVGFHDHPFGEEIFVLNGELQDQRGRYPVGSWQRLYPNTGHAPFAEERTLIILRNGHLPPDDVTHT